MKNQLKRIFSAFLSMAVLLCTFPSSVVTTSAEEPVNYECDAQDITNIQDGVILHCFDWKYTDIIEELPNIAAAGFNAVQTSPAQPGGNHDPNAASGTWWWLYQPLSFSIGKNYLGTKEELTQLCTEAHKYGIEIIVDIVSNHLAGDHTYIQEDLKLSEYWRESKSDSYWNSVSKRYKTTHKDLGMPDIVSENPYVQECVANYIQELKNVGVDGLRWDTLKHIQVPSENCAFFTTVLDEGMYSYGESLGDPGGDTDEQNVALMQEYTGLMSVTDDVYGRNLRNAFNSGTAPTTAGNWAYRGVNANTLVYWGESHDTWSNNDDYGYSNQMSQNVIDRAYAIAASRAGATSLYFSRPSETVKDNILAGVKGSTHFKSAEVAAVNHFHNAFGGQSEYYATSGNIAYTERGKKGVVLVNAPGGSASVSVPAHKMIDGTYTDQVTGSQFTVSGGTISGTIGSTGIAVVYNPDDVDEPYIKSSVIYMRPNDKWVLNKNERFAMYLWNASGEAWADLTDTDGDGTYAGDVPSGKWTGIIFCRMDGSNTENIWANKWNKTVDLFPDENTNRYTLRNGVWDETEENKGTWDAFGHIHSYGEPVWNWADDYSSAVATFACSGCDETFTATDNSAVGGYISTIRTHTASVTGPDGEKYSCTAYEPMVVQIPSGGGIQYQFTDTEKLAKLYQCIVNQETFADGSSIDVSACNILLEDCDSAVYALLDIFPEINFVDATQGFSMGSNGQYLTSLSFANYTMTKEEFDTKLEAFYSKANQYLSLINDDMDNFTKALILHDRLVLDHYYQIETEAEYSSNYTFMLDGWGRCENYSEVYAYLLARAGIKSEIVDGDVYYPPTETTPASTGAHEWVKICLNGEWYYVDITFDDPLVKGSDRPNKVSHKFFFVDDEIIESDTYDNGVKHLDDFNSYYATAYYSHNYDNLHSNENPFFYADDAFRTVYTKADEEYSNFENGVLALYIENDYIDFEYSDILPIKDRWSAGGSSVYLQNYSSLAEYDGKLYINGEHTVYEFDPELSTASEFVTYNEHQLYGIYVKDNVLYGLSADTLENGSPTPEALYTFSSNKYTVRWVNYDGTELKRESVTEGTIPSYSGTTPTRDSTAQYDYTFSGWTPDVTAVTEDVTYEADYTASVRNYTVTWKDYDNSVLETDNAVPYGTTPTYDSGTPSREGYTFKGWNPAVTEVTGNAVYTAEYDEILLSDTEITAYNFAGWDKVYIYYWGGNSTLAWPGVEMTSADGENFKFTYSIPSDMTNIIFNNGKNKPQTANLALTDGTEWNVSLTGTAVNAIPAQTYYLAGDTINNWITDKDWDNNSQYKFEINRNASAGAEEYMLSVELPAGVHIKVTDTNGTMYPGEGTSSYKGISTDACYTIYFRPNANGGSSWHCNYFKVQKSEYTVEFSDGVASQTVTYGDCAEEPEQPSKENYTFAGWYDGETEYDFTSPVTENKTLTAHWQENTVDISFIDVNGREKIVKVPVITKNFEVPKIAELDGRVFSGWKIDDNLYKTPAELKTAVTNILNTDINAQVTVSEIYELEESQQNYCVTVIGGTLSDGSKSKDYAPSSYVTVRADGGSAKQDFLYWTKDSIIVSYEQTYSFLMPSRDIQMNAVYGDSSEVEKKGTAYIESINKKSSNKLAFVAVISVPDDCTIIQAGLAATNDETIGNSISVESSTDVQGKKVFVKAITPPEDILDIKYTWTKGSISDDETWYVRAYVIYTSMEGGVYTEYGEAVTATLEEWDLSAQQVQS